MKFKAASKKKKTHISESMHNKVLQRNTAKSDNHHLEQDFDYSRAHVPKSTIVENKTEVEKHNKSDQAREI